MRPQKGVTMNPKVAKTGLKICLSLAASAVLGYLVKAEMKIEDKIDDYYDAKDEKEEETTED